MEDEEHFEDESHVTKEYDSLFDDISLEDDDVMLSDDDVMLEVIEEVTEDKSDGLVEDQPLLPVVQEEVTEDSYKLAIDQIDPAVVNLSTNARRLRLLGQHIDSLEIDSDSSGDCNYQVTQSTVNGLKELIIRLEDELHQIQVQQLEKQINALNVSVAAAYQQLSKNRKQLALKEKILQDSSTLICSLTNALDNAWNEYKSVQRSIEMFKYRCRKAERKSHLDGKRVSSSAARHEASLIEQQTLEVRVDELEVQIENMGAMQEQSKELEASDEVPEPDVNALNAELPDSTKTKDKVMTNASKLISKLALMELGYNEMLQYIMILEVELRKKLETNESITMKLVELEQEKRAAQEEFRKQQVELNAVQFELQSIEATLAIPLTPFIQAHIAAAAAMERSQQDFYVS